MRSRVGRLAAAVAIVAVLAVASGCGDGGEAGSTDGSPTVPEGCGPPGEPEELGVEVRRSLPHAEDAFTQGLVVHRGELVEGTGRIGESTLRVSDLDTGEELRRADLPSDVFGEGVAVGSDGELVQLTWTEGTAYRWSPGGPDLIGTFSYDGEGWGLATLGDGRLVMSDGTDVLTVRDPEDFRVVDRVRIRRRDGDAALLNELEFDGEDLWANRYTTDEIVRIDPVCGEVTGVADLSGLRSEAEELAGRSGSEIDVTNGIAHLPGTDRYLVTGKLWPTMYEVSFVAGDDGDASG